MRKTLIFLLVLTVFIGLFAAQSTVTYSTKTNLGDVIIYTFTWTNAATTDSAYVLGRDADGFLASNVNDRRITVEISSTEATADSVDWMVDLLGNHAASSTTTDWTVLATDSAKDATENYVSFGESDMDNFPYLGFVFRGAATGSNENAASQTITCRVFLDYDNRYIGKE